MQSHVVFRMADACRKQGISSLRFNFRGVGRSTGAYDAGEGEQEDVLAALDFLAEREPRAALWIAGFSFGAAVGARVGIRDARVAALLLVGAPVSMWPLDFLGESSQPMAFVSGDQDEFGQGLEALAGRLRGPHRLWRVESTTHLFEPAAAGGSAADSGQQRSAQRAARLRLEAALIEAIEYLQGVRLDLRFR